MASRKRLMSGWGPVPGRTAVIRAEVGEQALAPVERTRRAPGRKDTRRFCKGREGREHKPVIVFRPPWSRRPLACEWATRWVGGGVKWDCHHEEHCETCGKVLRTSLAPAECPGYPGSDVQKAQAWAGYMAAQERWKDWRASRRPVISGPQGYRRKRESA